MTLASGVNLAVIHAGLELEALSSYILAGHLRHER